MPTLHVARWALLVSLSLVGCQGPEGGLSSGGAERRPFAPRPGSDGLGDSYYPGLGNGGYDVLHYDLVLDVEPGPGTLEALARIELVPQHDLSSFFLDLDGLEVTSILVNGEGATYTRAGRELAITPRRALPTGQLCRVEVEYHGIPAELPDPGIPFVPGVGWLRTETGIHVMSEVLGSASWFPCNDHPRDKATYRFEVRVPEAYVAAANGLLVSEVLADGRRTVVFEASDPMATYLATLNIGDFQVMVQEGPRGIPVHTYLPQDATEEERTLFARQGELVTFLETRFGPYPFEAIGAVVSYEPIPGALETQTLSVYGRGMTEEVIVHELAHQWFGNSVSPADWSDLWLNEGFASYAEWLWTEQQQGPEALEARARAMHGLLRTRSVGSPVDPGLGELFSARTYVRGAYSLHRLRLELGDETFFQVLRTWLATFRDAHASTADFLALAERVAGRELQTFFDRWVLAPVVPETF